MILASFCLLVLNGLALAQKTEVDYPQVSGAETPRTVKTFLPDYIKYLFNLALLIAALVTFGSLVYGGFRYLASAGNPLAISDAKSQITAGILGLIILLIAYVILIQLNPELVVLKIGKVEFDKGVILYRAGINCDTKKADTSGLIEGEDFLRVRSSYSSLGDDFNDKATSVYFYDSGEEIEVKIFSNRDYQGLVWHSEDYQVDPKDCFDIPHQNQSIQLIWKMPGVYLFTDSDCKENPRLFTTSISDFTGFHDEARSIKIIPRITKYCIADMIIPPDFPMKCKALTPEEFDKACQDPDCLDVKVVDKVGVVLHEHSDFKGDAEVFFDGGPFKKWPPTCIALDSAVWGNEEGTECLNNVSASFCQQAVGKRASAITIFNQRPLGGVAATGGITLYQNYNFNDDEPGNKCGPYSPINTPQWINNCNIGGVSSIRIEGNYIAVLFRGDGRGEVFRESDIRLKDNHIGDNEVEYILVMPVIKRGI